MKHMVLFHKTPARWNKRKWIAEHFRDVSLNLHLEERPVTSGIQTLIDEDLYIQLCLKLREDCGIDHIHIVQGYEVSEAKNWFVEGEEGTYSLSESITYWSIGDLNHLHALPQADLVFSRGNYPHLHNGLREHIPNLSEAYWIHYPATSTHYPHLKDYYGHAQRQPSGDRSNHFLHNLIGMSVEHKYQPSSPIEAKSSEIDIEGLIGQFEAIRHQPIIGPYDVVLVDDVPLMDFYQNKFPNAEIVSFHKPCLHHKQTIRHQRQHDLMFCGTTLQATKNHMQFLDLLFSIDQVTASPLDIAIVGNQDNMPAFSEGLQHKFLHLRVRDYGEVSRKKLSDLFNDTRNVVVTSGRDCNPRIIQEAGVCGARVLAVDTLSDGLTVLSTHPTLGAVLTTEKSTWYYQKNGNLTFAVTPDLVTQLMEELEFSRHPRLTAKVAKELYRFEGVVQRLAERFMIRSSAMP